MGSESEASAVSSGRRVDRRLTLNAVWLLAETAVPDEDARYGLFLSGTLLSSFLLSSGDPRLSSFFFLSSVCCLLFFLPGACRPLIRCLETSTGQGVCAGRVCGDSWLM